MLLENSRPLFGTHRDKQLFNENQIKIVLMEGGPSSTLPYNTFRVATKSFSKECPIPNQK